MLGHTTLGAKEMRIKGMVTRLLTAVALTTAMTGGAIAVAAAPAQAAPTYCKTLNLSGNWAGFAINPRMTVPICYNGTSVWQNGNVTPGVSTVGWYVGGFDGPERTAAAVGWELARTSPPQPGRTRSAPTARPAGASTHGVT